MTTITIAGNLAADPELKFTASGKAVASFTIMSSKSVKKEDGNWESTEVTAWSIKCWNRMAENVAETLQKGMSVIVQGTASQVSWEDKNTGQKRSKIEVTAFNVGVDLKRHIVKVIALNRNAEGDVEENSWTAPSWQKATAVESIPF